MATSSSVMYLADKYVESAGTVLFRLSTREICVLRMLKTGEYVLPKGRRSVGENCRAAAIRETTEETGISCRLLPVSMATRVCPAIEGAHFPDKPRFFERVCEPIALQTRQIGEGEVKLIWWFVAAVNEDEPVGRHEEDLFAVEFCDYGSVGARLTFMDDCKLANKAIELVEASLNTDSRG